MRIAILYSGHFRTFLDVIENNSNRIINNNFDIDVYLNFWDTWGHGYVFKTQIFKEEDLIPSNILNNISNNVTYKFVEFEKSIYEFDELLKLQEDKPNSNMCINVISMFYKMQRGYMHIENSGIKYDYILKLRPDNFLERNIEFFNCEKNTIYTTLEPRWNLNGNGVNDQFAFGDIETMKIYLNTYNSLKDIFINNNCSPEILLKIHLDNHNVIVKDLFNNDKWDGIMLHRIMRENKILD